MDLATLKMDRGEARRAFLDYRKAVRERHDAEDEQIMRGYREVSRGRQVIALRQTILDGGTKEYDRRSWDRTIRKVRLPALAVMRADQKECWVRCGPSETVFLPEQFSRTRRDRIVMGPFPGKNELVDDFAAMVPIVPPPLRPVHHLRNYHILWEATWEQRYQRPRAPRDPALLKRLGGDLFAVLAVWDLTEVERAVLAGRGQ